MYYGLFLQPTVEPAKEGALPQNAVLGFQYPVVLIGEDEQFGRNATQTCGIEGTHTLVINNAEVFLAVDAEDGGIPLIYKQVGRVLISLVGTSGTVFLPISIVVLLIAEEYFFGVGVHGFEVESTIV